MKILLLCIKFVTLIISVETTAAVRFITKNLLPVDFRMANVKKSDLNFTLFTSAKDEGRKVDDKKIRKISLDKSIPMVIMIHGWIQDDTAEWYKLLKDAFFKHGPHNVVYTNWFRAGNKAYFQSSANVDPVGDYISNFIFASKVPLKNIQLVGHSLGSHVAAYVGKYIYKKAGIKVGRITALDPAGPRFENQLMCPEKRLNKEDAQFVDVVHTDIDWFGFPSPLGHVDFYPNEGKDQPGCADLSVFEICNHSRAAFYYIESIERRTGAKECTVFENMTITIKKNYRIATFGHHVNKGVRGTFTFKTNSKPPFLIKKIL